MCEVNVYLSKDGSDKVVMEDVDIVRPRVGSIYLENIFGERLEIKARIKEMSLVNRRILLVEDPKIKGDQ
ncbi:MAG: CooT family nickel-binding protein [Desulfobacterales bacterium]|nr:CooT family nickel-binding protein [Desulfobacterales bacterium]